MFVSATIFVESYRGIVGIYIGHRGEITINGLGYGVPDSFFYLLCLRWKEYCTFLSSKPICLVVRCQAWVVIVGFKTLFRFEVIEGAG